MTNKDKGEITRNKIKDFICEYYKRHLYMPSYTEIMSATGIKSKSTMFSHINRLYDEGVIESDHRGLPRAYRFSFFREESI